MRKLYHFSFYQRIQLLLVVFIILPVTVSLVVFYIITKEEVTDRVVNSNEQLLDVISTEIRNTIDDITFSTVLMERETELQNMLLELRDLEEITTYQDHTNFLSTSEHISLMETKLITTSSNYFIVNPQDFIINSSRGQTFYHSEYAWSQLKQKVNFQNNKTIQALGLLYNQETKGNDFYFARNIEHHNSGEFLGTVVIRIPHSFFDQFGESINMGKLTIFGSDDLIITEYESDTYEEKNNYTYTQYIERAHWKIQTQLSQKEISGSILDVFLVILGIIFVLIVLFFLASIILVRRIIKPVKNFEKVAKNFVKGNFSTRYQVEGNDEIAFIGNAFNNMLDQIEGLITEIKQSNEEKKALELQSLFAQIRPHFLINTLNSVKCNLSVEGDEFHSKKIDSLMRLLRSYMNANAPDTIKNETELIEDYVALMNMRNEMAVETIIDVSEEIEDYEIPRLLLQPIAENSIVHGFADRKPDAYISIVAYIEGSHIKISLSDNGMGMTEEKIHYLNEAFNHPAAKTVSTYKRVGLINIAQRLKLTFGRTASMTVENNEEGGVTFNLYIPLEDADQPD